MSAGADSVSVSLWGMVDEKVDLSVLIIKKRTRWCSIFFNQP
jgi:hypothetical protein